ncbi:predicted protein [Plenodomus lingam JN3]|uniref:Uncharacterized protein n=1 Tax=Leptosphaeria maculans (strain JN3 / isolate v23.1.3 / race Av1-4-5-6-7-8) TaxID=985895 RepID=E5A692_LEPMJ|nr:predicted protein [Plenodomus lingam JN3]CBX99137.1 predicted protein [Plenodomus lingam JN3]
MGAAAEFPLARGRSLVNLIFGICAGVPCTDTSRGNSEKEPGYLGGFVRAKAGQIAALERFCSQTQIGWTRAAVELDKPQCTGKAMNEKDRENGPRLRRNLQASARRNSCAWKKGVRWDWKRGWPDSGTLLAAAAPATTTTRVTVVNGSHRQVDVPQVEYHGTGAIPEACSLPCPPLSVGAGQNRARTGPDSVLHAINWPQAGSPLEEPPVAKQSRWGTAHTIESKATRQPNKDRQQRISAVQYLDKYDKVAGIAPKPCTCMGESLLESDDVSGVALWDNALAFGEPVSRRFLVWSKQSEPSGTGSGLWCALGLNPIHSKCTRRRSIHCLGPPAPPRPRLLSTQHIINGIVFIISMV